jgi:hypothetical protein
MSDWLDIDEPPALPIVVQEIADLKERVVSFEAAWKTLTTRQQKFLETWRDCNFNLRRTARALGDTTGTYPRWTKLPDFALCMDVMRRVEATQILNREKLIIRHDELVESLMTEKPVLHQGLPVYMDGKPLMEIEAAAAAKVNKDLLEIGGHAKPEQQTSFGAGPALIIQVTNKIGGEVISQVTVGAIPQHAPPEEDEWLSIPSDQ